MNELAKLRKKTGLSQTAFALLCGISTAAVSRGEAGKRKMHALMMEAIKARVAEHLKAKRKAPDYTHRAV